MSKGNENEQLSFLEETVPDEILGMKTDDIVDAINKEFEEVYSESLNEYGFTESEWNAPIFDGGPTRREIEEWKEKHGAVYFTPFDEEIFVWRTLTRPEYKVMIDDRSLNTMDREELMCEKVMLFPRNYTRESMNLGKAGIPSLLSEMIMDKSGFVAQSAPIKL